MSQYDNNLTGVLFINDKKQNDKHPDRKGSCEINGVKYWVSGWDRQTKRGDTSSLKFEVQKSASDAYTAKKSEPAQDDPDFDQSIPF